jgi:hypothetical protein
VTPNIAAGRQPAKVPPTMWRMLKDAHRSAKVTTRTVREEIILIGARWNYSETDLIKHGIIEPRPNPNPEPAA